jgi:uncharacterized protein YndB with AHSA1/START domain
MTNDSSKVVAGQAVTIKKTFSRETSVSVEINADPSIIWAVLTNAANYPEWNSTIISIKGRIAVGETIHLISGLDPKRKFKLKVKENDPERRLVWGDAMGNRIYSLQKNENGRILFSMSEKIGGPLFPLFARMIPSFDKSFEQFAADLKKKAETIMKKNLNQ